MIRKLFCWFVWDIDRYRYLKQFHYRYPYRGIVPFVLALNMFFMSVVFALIFSGILEFFDVT